MKKLYIICDSRAGKDPNKVFLIKTDKPEKEVIDLIYQKFDKNVIKYLDMYSYPIPESEMQIQEYDIPSN